MSWVTVIWSMIASACLTLAAMNLVVWVKKRTTWDNLLFSLTAASTAVYAGCELWMMRAETPVQFSTVLRWCHVPVWAIIVTLVGFVRLHMRAGRPWLAWTVCAVRTFALMLNFLVGQNLNYREVTHLRQIPLFGESISVAEGVSNPWMLVGQLSLLLFVLFVSDAAITVWRRGDRRLALVTGGSIVSFAVAGLVLAVLVLWGIVHWPLVASWFFMAIVVSMAYEMINEMLRAAQLSDELQQKRNELSHIARVSTMGQLASTLAHELNQPLGAILRNAEAAKLFLDESSPDLDEVRAILSDICKDDQRAGEVIDRMRSLLKRGKVENDLLDLNLSAGEVISLVRPEADTRNVRLVFEPSPSASLVRGDRVHLQQVMLNLLINAMEAMDDSAPDGRVITVRLQAGGTQVEVVVSDNGQGIPTDKLDQVFEPFYSSKTNGLGMGLAISRGIIEAHGGRLRAQNNEAGGTTFTITLPTALEGAK